MVAAFIYPKVIKNIDKRSVSIELSGQLTRGQMVTNHSKINTNINAVIFEELNVEILKNLLLWAVGHDDIESDKFSFGL